MAKFEAREAEFKRFRESIDFDKERSTRSEEVVLYIGGDSLRELIERLTAFMGRSSPDADLDFLDEDGHAHFHWMRPETDDEVFARLVRERNAARFTREKELKELARLKAKYEKS
jgi:hypothetical protein